MKKLFILCIFMLSATATMAACPDKWEEIHMENMVLTDVGQSCPANTESYYTIEDVCNQHVL